MFRPKTPGVVSNNSPAVHRWAVNICQFRASDTESYISFLQRFTLTKKDFELLRTKSLFEKRRRQMKPLKKVLFNFNILKLKV